MMTNTVKLIATCLILSVSMQMCTGSAIPIWEFLTRNEKMSYLYSTFAQLVSVHCKATTTASSSIPVNQCKRNLLAYGYERLQTFTNEQLDLLDPYQRGANELIWSSIMREHPSSTLITTRKPLPTPPASSIIILTHQKHASTPSATNSNSGPALPNYPENPLFNGNADRKQHQYAMDMDVAYGYPQTSNTPQTYLTGPLVIRVRPDGTPVEEDKYKPLPRDDDLEAFQLTSSSTTANINSNPNANPNGSGTGTGSGSGNGRPKHRKIATISALKQQHLATLAALQQQLQPPFESPRIRRQFQLTSQPFRGYYYGLGQA